MAKILILETTQGYPVSELPEDLEYSSCVAKEIAPALRSLGHEVIEIQKPTPADAVNAIETHNPDVIWHCGHGQVCITTLENTEEWMTHKSGSYSACTVDKYLEYAPNRFFSMLSCLASSELGPQLINKGATAFMGYYESFWFLLCEGAPCPCGRELTDSEEIRGIKGPAQCDLEWLHALAEGKTVNDAYNRSQAKFQSEIEYWEGSTHEMAADILYCLRLDKERQVSLGDMNARITALGTPTPTATPTATPIPEYGNLSGYIRDNETSNLLSGVLIDIAGKQTTTNGSGYYRITDIPIGTHKLTISSIGYITQAPTVEISVGENYYNTSLDRAPEVYGDIKGRVLDRFGNAIKGAIAKVEDTGQYDDTDSQGYYVITSVPVGTHVITISAAGYETETTETYISEGLNNIGDTTVYPGVMPIPEIILCLVPRIHTGNITPRVSTGDPIPRIRCLMEKGGIS